MGDLLENQPDVIRSSSKLHDDLAADTARIRSTARLAVLKLHDNMAVRRALGQGPRPFREYSVGDEVAVWRRGTGKVSEQTETSSVARTKDPLGLCSGQQRCCHDWERNSRRGLKTVEEKAAGCETEKEPQQFCVRKVQPGTSRTSRSKIGLEM